MANISCLSLAFKLSSNFNKFKLLKYANKCFAITDTNEGVMLMYNSEFEFITPKTNTENSMKEDDTFRQQSPRLLNLSLNFSKAKTTFSYMSNILRNHFLR